MQCLLPASLSMTNKVKQGSQLKPLAFIMRQKIQVGQDVMRMIFLKNTGKCNINFKERNNIIQNILPQLAEAQIPVVRKYPQQPREITEALVGTHNSGISFPEDESPDNQFLMLWLSRSHTPMFLFKNEDHFLTYLKQLLIELTIKYLKE